MRNRLTETLHFLRSYFSDQPSYLILFATAVCNARCKHCFYWEEIESAEARTELTLDEIKRVADGMSLIYLSVAGGEPFLRSDLVEVVQAFYERSGILYASVVTNGFYTDRAVEWTREILRRCPRLKLKVQVSFDDLETEHDANRGIPGIYAKAADTLVRLSREVRASNPRFSLDVATCLTKTNKDRVRRLHDLLRSRCEFDSYQFLYPRGNAMVAGEKDVTAAEYAAALDYANAGAPRGAHNAIIAAVQRVARDGVLAFLERDAHPWPCLAGRKFVSLTEKGVLQPCEHLSQMRPEEDSDLADLRREGLDVRRALATPKAREVVRGIRESRCRCSFECAANCNVVFSPTQALRILSSAGR